MLLGLNGATIMHTPWDVELGLAARAGFAATEARHTKVRDFLASHSVSDVCAMLDAAGLVRGPLNALLDGVFGRSPAEVDEECAWLCKLASEFSMSGIVVTPGPCPSDASWADVRQAAVNTFQRLGRIGEEHGVDIGVEFIGLEGAAMTTLEQAYEVTQAVARENVRLVLDLFSFFSGGSSLEAIGDIEPGRILVVHVADCPDPKQGAVGRFDRLQPGDGVAPLRRMLQAVLATGYEDLVCVEVFNQSVWAQDPWDVSRLAYARMAELVEGL
jgi:2-keto-myo-inositol isomerase